MTGIKQAHSLSFIRHKIIILGSIGSFGRKYISFHSLWDVKNI